VRGTQMLLDPRDLIKLIGAQTGKVSR